MTQSGLMLLKFASDSGLGPPTGIQWRDMKSKQTTRDLVVPRPFTETICELMEQIRVIDMPNDDGEIWFELPESIRGTQ
jgi:hypothetical protein